jgi:hypothetical protein
MRIISHRITSVDNEIHDDFLDLGWVCHYLSREWVERDGEFDVLANETLEHALRVVHNHV